MSFRSSCWSLLPLSFSLVVATSQVACNRSSEPSEAAGEVSPANPDGTYPLRGIVKRVPSEPGAEAVIRHEAIDGFVDQAGKKVGMKAMTMGFVVDAWPEGVAAGDKVEFTYEVRFRGKPMNRAVGLRKLPADTKLAFE